MELTEVNRLILSLFGVLLVFASLRMMAVGLGVGVKGFFTLLSLAPTVALHGGWYSRLRSKFAYRLALRTSLAQESGPKFVVGLTLRAEGKVLGEDTGILSLAHGHLRYEGLRTEFCVPKDFVKRLEEKKTKVGVKVGEEWVWLEFRELERLDAQGIFSDLPYAFGNFWIGPSVGPLRLPPAVKAPKVSSEQRRGYFLQALFWIGLSIVGIYQGRTLRTQGLTEAQMTLVITFALTATVATFAPVVRLVRTYRSLKPLPRPETTPEIARVNAIAAEEAVGVSTTR